MNPSTETTTRITPIEDVTEQHLGKFSDEHRQLIINRMVRLVDLDSQSVSVDTGDEIPDISPEQETGTSLRVHKLLDRIGRELAYNHSGQQDEDYVWRKSIMTILGRTNGGLYENEHIQESHEAALIMARLSGNEEWYFQHVGTEPAIKANKSARGLAVINPEGEGYMPVSHPETEVVAGLIDAGAGHEYDVVRYKALLDMSDTTLAETYIDKNRIDMLAGTLHYFSELDQSIAKKLMDKNYMQPVIHDISHFKDLDHKEVADRVIAADRAGLIVDSFYNFYGLGDSAAVGLIDKGYTESVAEYLYRFDFKTLSSTVAEKLIDAGFMQQLAFNVDKFDHLPDETLLSLIHNGHSDALVGNVIVFKNRENILGEVKEQILLDPSAFSGALEHFNEFGFTHDQARSIFLDLSQSSYPLAQSLLEADLSVYGLHQDAIDEIRERAAQVEEPMKGLSDENPYLDSMSSLENVTITTPGSKEHEIAVGINRRLRNAYEDESDPLHFIAMTINAKYSQLLDGLQEVVGIDTTRLVSGDGMVTNALMPLYRRLTADFITLQLKERDGDIDSLNENGLDVLDEEVVFALERANSHFIEIFKRDVPYYDKLFSEWDIKRVGQREFQEVFLGRDGVYAYVGRRAQMYARQRVLGLDVNNEMPTYLVYPRLFMGFDDKLKKMYLDQTIKNPKAAHYFDTGFVGTIPLDIMKVLGMSENEWDQRIRLLSAGKIDRVVLRVRSGDRSDNERSNDVHAIENEDKDEDTALGLYYAEDGDTRELKHYAKPFSPIERLSFAVIQQALHRHYYTNEFRKLESQQERITMKQHQLDGVELRVRAQLSDEQTSEIVEFFDGGNIGQILLAKSTHIQLSNPSDPYPNEAVFEVPLSGTTDGIIIKSANPAKSQGPLDEFEALLLLEELGVDAPRPLARIFTSDQHGFIAMEKLPGVSGRTFINNPEIAKLRPREKQRVLQEVLDKMKAVTEVVRRDAGFDKSWTIDDFMIVIGKDKRRKTVIERILPIDFRGARVYDPSAPEIVYLGQDLDNLLAGIGDMIGMYNPKSGIKDVSVISHTSGSTSPIDDIFGSSIKTPSYSGYWGEGEEWGEEMEE